MIPHPPSGFAWRHHPCGIAVGFALVACAVGAAGPESAGVDATIFDAAERATNTPHDVAEGRMPQRRVPRRIALVGVDTPGDPAAPSPSAGSSPADSSGPFDVLRDDIGEDDDLSLRSRRGRRFHKPAEIDTLPDPLRGSPTVSPAQTGVDAEQVLRKMLPPRSDSWADWSAGVEPLHVCGEPRWLPPCVPPPPCHPSQPPRPYDLVGVRGTPTDGPIYRGPCAPRTGTHDDCPLPHVHRWHDRLFDWFYMWK